MFNVRLVLKKIEGSYKGVAGVVQYVPSIIEEYSKIIKSERSIESPSPHCITNLNYTSTFYGKIDDRVGNLSSLDISTTQELIQYSLGDKIVYLVKGYNRHLPYITPDEYENGLRILKMPPTLYIGDLKCGNIINEKVESHNCPRKCNDGKVHKNCAKTFTLSGGPFVFANEQASCSFPILYQCLVGS